MKIYALYLTALASFFSSTAFSQGVIKIGEINSRWRQRKKAAAHHTGR
jgi:hypothetical protein